jgi:hypothetical protein
MAHRKKGESVWAVEVHQRNPKAELRQQIRFNPLESRLAERTSSFLKHCLVRERQHRGVKANAPSHNSMVREGERDCVF